MILFEIHCFRGVSMRDDYLSKTAIVNLDWKHRSGGHQTAYKKNDGFEKYFDSL